MLVDLKRLAPQKILVINTFGIGDVLFTTPFVANLKANFPGCTVGYLGNRRTSSILESNPDIDKVHIYERDEFNRIYKESKWQFFSKLRQLLGEVRSQRYDLVFDFSLNQNINFLTQWAGIKHRVGLNYKNRMPHSTIKIPFDGFENKHVTQHYLDLLTSFGLTITHRELKLSIRPEDQQWADRFLQEQGWKQGEKLIGIIPGAGESWGTQARFRRWDAANYGKLIDKIIEKAHPKFILMGAKAEEDLCRELTQDGSRELIESQGKTTIGQLAALIKRCHLVVLNDGGPLHVAVAVKTKTVSVFGPVDEVVYGPFGPKSDHLVVKKNLLCQPCYRRFRMTDCQHLSCLTRLSVDDVYEKVSQLL